MKIGGIIGNGNLALFQISALKDEPGTAALVLRYFAAEKINIEYITESGASCGNAVLAFCVAEKDAGKVDHVLKHSMDFVDKTTLQARHEMTVIGIYGPHFREKPAIAARFCRILGETGINIYGMSSSISSICCVIEKGQYEAAYSAIVNNFELP